MTFDAIAEWMNKEGHLTVRGKRFRGAHVHSILKKRLAKEKEEKEKDARKLQTAKEANERYWKRRERWSEQPDEPEEEENYEPGSSIRKLLEGKKEQKKEEEANIFTMPLPELVAAAAEEGMEPPQDELPHNDLAGVLQGGKGKVRR